MKDEQHIKELLEKIRELNPEAFNDFASKHSICFQPKKENWLFPMLFDYYVNVVQDKTISELVKELGLTLHRNCQEKPLSEVTHIDRSLCIDDSYVEDYVRKVQSFQSEKPVYKDLNSPWKTRGINLSLYEIPEFLLNSVVFEFKDKEHPYILADIAGMYIYAQKFEESLGYLYRSIRLLATFPNRFWNSEYGLVGAVNTFRLLLLMFPKQKIEIYRKLFSYDYIYLTKLACNASDEIFQQNAYVNRASIVISPFARYVIPLHINPDLLYISDMYYAHYCNELAETVSFASGWKYNMKSLTYYQNASFWPNDTGGYVDIEDKNYGQIVSEKHELAKEIAFSFYSDIYSGKITLQDKEIELIFKTILNECKYNYKALRNRTLNFKSYK
jgi:hypothetical protein